MADRCRSLLAAAALGFLLLVAVAQAEAADRWAVWEIDKDGKAEIYLRDSMPGFSGAVMASEAECLLMAEKVRRDHLIELAELNTSLAKRGKAPLTPYLRYECRRQRE